MTVLHFLRVCHQTQKDPIEALRALLLIRHAAQDHGMELPRALQELNTETTLDSGITCQLCRTPEWWQENFGSGWEWWQWWYCGPLGLECEY